MDSLRASGIGAVACMLKNCRSQVAACIADPDCKAGLDCLQACSPTDQVGIFEALSHATGNGPVALLQKFSL